MSNEFKAVVVAGAPAEVRDTAVYAHRKADLDFGLNDLVAHDSFVRSLADTKTRGFNVENLFERNLRPLIADDKPPGAPAGIFVNKPLLIAENDATQELATTTVSVLSKDRSKTTEVHIVVNKEFGRSLVVGDAAPRGLKRAFAKAGIRYVDRNAKNALAEIREGIADVVGRQKDQVGMAFRYRNESPETECAAPDLARMLASKRNEMVYPKYVVKR